MEQRKSLLIVERNKGLRDLFYEKLRGEHYRVRAVHNSETCLKQLGEIELREGVRVTHKFDLVCLDTGIKYEGGVMEFCERIKSKGIGLLLMMDSPYITGELLETGLIDGYTNKNLNNLKAAVRNYFDYVHSTSQ